MAMVSEPASPLQRIREERGVSQRLLAEKLGISRGRLRRLEGKEFEQVTYRELQRISQALGVGMEEIFLGSAPAASDFHLGRKGQSVFQWDSSSAGYKIISLLPARKDFFVGKLFLSAKKRIPAAHTPRAQTLFLEMVLGKFRLERGSEAYEIEEGDHLLFPGDIPYTIENPLLRDSAAFLLTFPAFGA